jgi:Leucine-rich repeat (LRR) protein
MVDIKWATLPQHISIINMPYNPATKAYTKTCNGRYLLGSERGEFLKELKTLPADVETIDINLIQNLERLPDLGHYTALKSLNLHSIGLKVFDCSLPDSLEILDISFNSISEMTRSLPNRLKALDISFNPITVLPVLPDTLTHLGCTMCPIEILPPLPPTLEVLYATSCGLTSLPDLPKSLTTVCVLSNNIKPFPPFPPTITTLKIDW